MSAAPAIELTCSEVRLILRVLDIDTPVGGMSEEVRAAFLHYGDIPHRCWKCAKLGLAAITGKPLSCQDALAAWASKPNHHLNMFGSFSTMREALACEHVRGWIQREEMSHYPEGGCSSIPCTALRELWANAHLSSGYDGQNETAEFFPLIIEGYIREGWPLDKIARLQNKHLITLLKKVRKSSVAWEQEVAYLELEANIELLPNILNAKAQKGLHNP